MPQPSVWLKKAGAFASRHGLRDKWLLLAVLLGLGMGAQGIGWGRYDCLNLDAMAFRNVFAKDRPPMHPGEFLKPPFYTYVNHFAARLPAQVITGACFWKDKKERGDMYVRVRLILARLINLSFFASLVTMVFLVTRVYFGTSSARVAALLLATTAGMICYQVYLTTDLALLFMMMTSFACACAIVRNPTMGLSVAAGLLAGLATATKYNGLAVAIALPLAHLLASRGNPLLACLRRPAAWACGLAVPVGFLIGNPYALFDWPKFRSDFYYNYTTTPVYGGIVEGHGYASFFERIPELLGWPGTILVACGLLTGLLVLAFNLKRNDAWKLWVLALSVFVLYTWKIGEFPRMTTRFVLPAIPFLLILAASGFGVLARRKFLFLPVLAGVLVYNLVCGWWMGELFREDPRMRLLTVVEAQMVGTTTVEASKSIPSISSMSGRDIRSVKMPGAMERAAQFDKMFANNEDMQKLKKRWKSQEGPEWFTKASREKRGSEWVIWCSNDVEKIVQNEYQALFDRSSGYEVVFDAASPVRPSWTYPRHPDFIENRTTVWKKLPAAGPPLS
ncbi:MAG: ArnT family glycosyltransferase [Terrimicrobiaceae bacterium]